MDRDTTSSGISDCANSVTADQTSVTFHEHPDECDRTQTSAFFRAPSTPGAITELRQRIVAFMSTPSLSSQELTDLALAIGEACTNAMRHGSPRGSLDEVVVKCVKEPHRLVVEISDSGYGFDPAAVPMPSAEQLKEGGMGIFLMRTCVDKVEFGFGPGTTVRLVKYCRSS